MFEMIIRWYKRRFSDPHAVSLVAILLVGFITIYFFGHLIAPLLVAIVLAYLLEWPVNRLSKLGIPRILQCCCGRGIVYWFNATGFLWASTDDLETNR